LLRTRLRPNPGLTLGLMESLALESRGVPGLAQHQSRHAHSDWTRSVGELSLQAPAWPASQTDTESTVTVDWYSVRFTDREGEVGLGRRELTASSLALGLRGRSTWFVTPWLDAEAVADLRLEQMRAEEALGALATRSAQRLTTAPALELRVHHPEQTWTLLAAGRLDLTGSDFDGTTGVNTSTPALRHRRDEIWQAQLGLRVGAPGPADLELEGRLGLGFYGRLPSFLEMFGDTGALVGNPELSAERSQGGDLGLSLRSGSQPVPWSLSLALFSYRHGDLIQLVQNSQRVARAENVSRARIDGLEAFGALEWGPLRLSSGYTLTDPMDQSQRAGQGGNVLPGRPRHSFFNTLGLVWSELELSYSLDFESGNMLDRANFRQVPDRLLHGASLAYSPDWAEGLTLALDAYNLLDDRTEQVSILPQPPGVSLTAPQALSDYWGFPLPGRSVFATLSWHPELQH
jgi:hypothetical protein